MVSYTCGNLTRWFVGHWRTWVLIALPFILLVLPLVPSLGDEYYPYVPRYAYGLLMVALSWIFELLPIPVTAMLPVVIFPMAGVVKSGCVSSSYLNNTSFLFIGALIIACAIESCGLHRRIALFALKSVGSNPRWMLFSTMIIAWILGMFISNTATTAMMLPIVEQILKELGEDDVKTVEVMDAEAEALEAVVSSGDDMVMKSVDNAAFEKERVAGEEAVSELVKEIKLDEAEFVIETDDDREFWKNYGHMGLSNSELLAKRKWFIQGEDLNDLRDEPMTKKKFKIIAKSLSLGVPYASNIGGLATLTGNTSNLILAGEFSESFPLAPPITYTSWLLYNLPASFFFIWFAYLWIMVLMFGADKEDMSRAWKFQMTRQERKTSIFIENQFRDLGAWRMSEIEVGIVFVLTILLWFFEDPGFMPGWAELFRPNFVSNSQPAIFMGVLLFILPEESPFAVFEMSQAEIDESIAEGITIDPQSGDVSGGDPWQPVKAILDWHFVEKHVPWGVVFLMGGGFSLAFCSKQAGFSCWMAQNFSYLSGLPVQLIAFVITVCTGFFTEFASNAATCALFVPILALMAKAICVNPYWLMMTCAQATNLAFMLPVAEPSNAIAFSYGRIEIRDTVTAGLMMNLLGFLVITIFINTLGYIEWGLASYPCWAADDPTNCTCTVHDGAFPCTWGGECTGGITDETTYAALNMTDPADYAY